MKTYYITKVRCPWEDEFHELQLHNKYPYIPKDGSEVMLWKVTEEGGELTVRKMLGGEDE